MPDDLAQFSITRAIQPSTPCGDCGHPYFDHAGHDCRVMVNELYCRCPGFVLAEKTEEVK